MRTEPVQQALDRLIGPLRVACGCESLRVQWRLTDALCAEATAADSLRAVLAGESAGQPDRPVARVQTWRAGRLREVVVAGDALCPGLAWVALRPVRARSVVSPADVDSLRGWFPPSVIAAPGRSPIGSWTEDALPRGRPLVLDRLGEPPLVRAGGEVRLVCLTGGLRVEGRGTSRTDARMGDRVEVRLEGGRRDCRGVVSGPAEVTVLLEGGAR